MELTVDIGSNVYEDLETASKIEGKSLESTASAMLALGVKIFLSSDKNKIDSTTSLLLENSAKTNEILTEILYTVFDKDKSKLGVYDAETALALIDRMIKKYMQGFE